MIVCCAAVAVAAPRAWADDPAPVQPAVGSTAPPPAPADRGRFAALWVVPLASRHFQGAGLEAGYRFQWIAGVYRIGFVQNGYEPVSGAPLLALERTNRILLDLEIDLRWRFANMGTIAAGGGVGFLNDNRDITSMSGTSWTTVHDDRWRVRPLLGATLAGPLFQASVIGYIGSQSEARFSLGVCWGRR
jgi:hypothetical protein